MGTFRALFRLSTTPVVAPPNGLVEGVIPYGQLVGRWSYIVGTWGADAPAAQFDGTPQTDAIFSYRASLTATGYICNLYPPGVFLDSLDQFDIGGTAEGNGQVPLDVLVKPRGGQPFLLNQFLGENNGVYNVEPMPHGRIEVEWTKQQSYGPLATWPSQLRPVGAYSPAQLVALAAGPAIQPTAIGPLFGICFDWYFFDEEEERADVLDFAGGRDYAENYNIKLDDGLIHLAPSFNANRSEMMDVWNAHNKFYIPSFNNGFRSARASYTSEGTLDVDAWHNAPVAKGADKLNPETWREAGEFIWQVVAREGRVTQPLDLLQQATEPRFPGDSPVQQVETGTGRLRRFTFGNEWIKTWKGRDGHVTSEEAAVAYCVLRNGYNNTMGPCVGWENADPSIEMGIGQAFAPIAGDALSFFLKIGEIGGFQPDGTILLQPAYYEIHDYLRDSMGRALPFELSQQPQALRDLHDVINRYSPSTQLVMGEWGYTGYYEATGYVDALGENQPGYSFFDAAYGYTAQERRAGLTFMGGIFLAYYGVKMGCLYQLHDQATPALGVAWDKLCGYAGTLFHAWLKYFLPVLHDYVPVACSNPSLDPSQPYVFTLQVPAAPSRPTLYLLYATGELAVPVTLTLPGGGTLLEFDRAGGPAFLESPVAGPVTARELPVLVRAS